MKRQTSACRDGNKVLFRVAEAQDPHVRLAAPEEFHRHRTLAHVEIVLVVVRHPLLVPVQVLCHLRRIAQQEAQSATVIHIN